MVIAVDREHYLQLKESVSKLRKKNLMLVASKRKMKKAHCENLKEAYRKGVRKGVNAMVEETSFICSSRFELFCVQQFTNDELEKLVKFICSQAKGAVLKNVL